MLCVLSLLSPLAAKAPAKTPAAGLDAGYVPALAAADHFLQAWQSGDLENGIALLTSRAKEASTTEVVERFFSNPGPSAYEIDRGKLLKPGRYEFPVVLIGNSKDVHPRRRFSSIIVVNTGNHDWAVDKLP
jgi:hypothetical protein